MTPFVKKSDYSSDLTIFIISFISAFKVINVITPNVFSRIGASFVAADVDSNRIKTLLANGFTTFFIKDNPVLSNGLKSLPENPPDCPNLYNWVFDNFILAE